MFGAYDDLVEDDPAGMELTREKLFEFWPQLDLVATQSRGSTVGRDQSPDGKGYGGVPFVSKYSMSVAFLATAHFKNQDSLAARMWQARYTGMFRFSCKAFVDFMSDPTTSNAGSNNHLKSAFNNSEDFKGRYDRNFLVMAALLYERSYILETGEKLPAPEKSGVHEFWEENCVLPAMHRTPLPKVLLDLDPMVYGERDIMRHDVPLHTYGPLRAFGSLRQIRDRKLGGLKYDMNLHDGLRFKVFEEDFTNKEGLGLDFDTDRKRRKESNLHRLYKYVICDPRYKYSIEDAIGDPPLGGERADLKGNTYYADSRVRGESSENWMRVNDDQLGHSGTKRRVYHGCGLGIEVNGCESYAAPNYEFFSLWQWVYITSSQCESAFQTKPNL